MKIILFLILFQLSVASDLTLKQCIDIALSKNPDLLILKNNYESSKSKVKESISGYMPQVSGTLSYSRRVTPLSTSFGSVSFPGLEDKFDVTTYTTGLSLQQNIWDFGRTSSVVSRAKINEEFSLLNFEKKKIEITFQVKKNYYNLLQAKAMKEIATLNLQEIKNLLEEVREKKKQGLATYVDVLNAESEYVKFKAEIKKTKHQIDLATIILANILGESETSAELSRTPYESMKPIAEEKFPSPEEFPLGFKNFDECKNRAIASRLEFKEIELQEKLANANVSGVYSEWFPAISGSATYDLTDNYFFPKQKSWSFGVNISIPIFSGFGSKARLESSESDLKNIETNKKLTTQNVLLQVKVNYYKVIEAKENVEVTKKKQEYLEKNLEANNAKYKEGFSTVTELIDAQTKKVSAEFESQQALYNYYVALSELEYSIGWIK